jgi:hypothetical protein
MEQAEVCPNCMGATETIRLSGGLTVEVQDDRLLVGRGSAVVDVFRMRCGTLRHCSPRALGAGSASLVDALVKAARLVGRKTKE